MDIFQNCISDRAGIVTQIDSEHKILIIKGDNSDLLHLQLFPRGVMFLVTDSQKYVFGAEYILILRTATRGGSSNIIL
jgi:hypothetical protein